MGKGGNSGLLRHGTYDVKTVLEWMDADEKFDTDSVLKEFEGLNVLSGLLGYKVFKHKGTKCVCCPVEGQYFALEKTPGRGRNKYNKWHFNLYGKDAFGREVMITKDHVQPRSKGGSNELENLQPMCLPCNMNKGSLHMKEFEAKRVGKTYDWNIDHAQHVIKRIKERYSVDMTMEEFPGFLENTMLHSEIIHYVSSSKSYRKVYFKGTHVYAVYSSLYKTVYTVIDPSTLEDVKNEIPYWGRSREADCRALYTEIKATIDKQFKVFPTEKETALYLRSCKYSTLMFAHWKGKSSRLNYLIWEVIKSTLKLNYEEDTEQIEKHGVPA